jgi:hypothetical protein
VKLVSIDGSRRGTNGSGVELVIPGGGADESRSDRGLGRGKRGNLGEKSLVHGPCPFWY